MFYIDEDNANSLRNEENRSLVVNKLLREHYATCDIKKLTPEEIDKRIAVLKIKLKAKEEIAKLENGTN